MAVSENYFRMIIKQRIAPFESALADQVRELILSIQNNEFGMGLTLDDQADLKDIESYYQRNGGNFWVTLDGNKVVGTIGVFDIRYQQCVIRKMFVQKEYRGGQRGIGRALLLEALEWCRARKMEEVYLGTSDKLKRAIEFYRRNGFLEIQKADLPAAFPGLKVENRFFCMDIRGQ